MTLIEEIVERLQKYPQLSFRVQANSIQVDSTSSTGFSISLICGRAGYTVCFDGWHEEFSSEEEAAQLFRLRIERRVPPQSCPAWPNRIELDRRIS